jgi:truncated hemoglobin YjbI
METLLERMGGASAVIDAIEGLHDRMLADDTLTPFLEGIDADVWSAKQFDFLGRMLEASEYDAQRLRVSHQRLVDAGLGDAHFDRTMEYLREALVDAEVPADCLDEVIAAFESTRADILCK